MLVTNKTTTRQVSPFTFFFALIPNRLHNYMAVTCYSLCTYLYLDTNSRGLSSEMCSCTLHLKNRCNDTLKCLS